MGDGVIRIFVRGKGYSFFNLYREQRGTFEEGYGWLGKRVDYVVTPPNYLHEMTM